MSEENPGKDYDYIIRTIQYLDRRFGIRFFIGNRDFDVLYRWWEKRIPEELVREAIDRVVARGRRRLNPPARFSAFSGEVRRTYRSFLSLNVGRSRPEPIDEHAEANEFMAHFPPALDFMREDFGDFFQRLRNGEAADASLLEGKLLDHFQDDGELNTKAAWFLNNLAPPLRRPDIERRYRLNHLMCRFGIPALE